jgi:hypothetical protein
MRKKKRKRNSKKRMTTMIKKTMEERSLMRKRKRSTRLRTNRGPSYLTKLSRHSNHLAKNPQTLE